MCNWIKEKRKKWYSYQGQNGEGMDICGVFQFDDPLVTFLAPLAFLPSSPCLFQYIPFSPLTFSFFFYALLFDDQCEKGEIEREKLQMKGEGFYKIVQLWFWVRKYILKQIKKICIYILKKKLGFFFLKLKNLGLFLEKRGKWQSQLFYFFFFFNNKQA